VLAIGATFYFIWRSTTPGTKQICEDEKKMSFSGIVSNIVLDSANRSRKFVILSNGTKIITPYTYGLWNEVQVGDSLVKIINTLNYIVYKKPNYRLIKRLNWDRPCQ
jgi:hypothetical protein